MACQTGRNTKKKTKGNEEAVRTRSCHNESSNKKRKKKSSSKRGKISQKIMYKKKTRID